MFELSPLLLAYATLFVSSFVAATLVPAGSELVVTGMLLGHSERLWPVVAIATLGNTLGGLTSYAIGRLLPRPSASEVDSHTSARLSPRAQAWLARYGVLALLLSWLPLVGDALCVGAGWLRFSVWSSTVCIGVGKFLRYLVLAYASVSVGG